MIAVDTNIWVRYAVKDDPRQTLVATEFLKSNGFATMDRRLVKAGASCKVTSLILEVV